MAKVFISYRRTDNASISGRIYDRLVAKFGRNNVFKDVDDSPPGVRFGAYIQESLRQCAAMLVIIGRDWLDTQATEGGRRLDDPKDGVRIEVETAFVLGLTVIPLLVEGARMPKAAQLPESLQELAQIQSLQVRNDADFVREIDLVVAELDRAFASHSSPGSMARRAVPSQAPATPPPAPASQSTPVPVSDLVAASAAPASAAAQLAVQEKPLAQARQGRAGLRRFWRPLVAILAVVLIGSCGVLHSKSFVFGGPTVTEYHLPSSGGHPVGITSGPDGALWFTEPDHDKIGRITTGGGHN